MSDATDIPIVIGEGLCYLSVCASNLQAKHEVEAMIRSRHTAGTERGWLMCDDPTFASGEPNPCPCDQFPDTRTHWLMSC